jgi:hypothetical protein
MGAARVCRTAVLWAAIVVGLAAVAGQVAADGVTHHPLGREKGLSYEGTQRTLFYTLDYTYVFQAGTDAQPAALDFNARLVPRRGLATLTVRLHFQDGAGRRLATHTLYAPGAGQGAGRATISRRIEVPDGAVQFVFSQVAREHRGRLRR